MALVIAFKKSMPKVRDDCDEWQQSIVKKIGLPMAITIRYVRFKEHWALFQCIQAMQTGFVFEKKTGDIFLFLSIKNVKYEECWINRVE